MESDKKELTLSLNSFDTPKELTGIEAWIQLIVNLMFIRKGQYPSNPRIGIGIQDYDYMFLDEAKETIENDLKYQTETFLSDIPIDSIEVTSTTINSQVVLIILITLRYEGRLVTSVVASTRNANNNIEFEIKL